VERIKEKLIKFMTGRYGVDQLYYGMFALWVVLTLVNIKVDSMILMAVSDVFIVLAIFRGFSRNISRRTAENEKFLKVWNPVKRKVRLFYRRIREIRVHRFRTCPHCKKTLQLPIKRGKNTVKCPRCQEKFDVHIML
jgi:ssDNA-binding Zn-finger/Zn-ribbon topoisomerase 1